MGSVVIGITCDQYLAAILKLTMHVAYEMDALLC